MSINLRVLLCPSFPRKQESTLPRSGKFAHTSGFRIVAACLLSMTAGAVLACAIEPQSATETGSNLAGIPTVATALPLETLTPSGSGIPAPLPSAAPATAAKSLPDATLTPCMSPAYKRLHGGPFADSGD